MSAWKRILLLLAVFLLVLGVVCFPFRAELPSWIATLRHSWDDLPYQLAASGGDDMICAARIGENGTLELRLFDPSDKRSLEKWEVTLPQEASMGELSMVYPMGSTCVYFGVYEEDAQHLSLYRAEKEQPAERILREDCAGDTAAARKNSRAFSEAARQQDAFRITLLTEDTVLAYSHDPENGLQLVKTRERNGTLSAIGVADTIYLGENAEIALTYAGNGLFYVDGADMRIRFADLSTQTHDMELLNLGEYIGDRQLTSVSLTRDGSALLLLDGHILNLVQENGVQDLTDRLYPTWGDCVVRVVLLLAVALVLSIVLWWLMAGRSRGRLPLAVYWGVVSLALFYVAGVAFVYGLVAPAEDESGLWKKISLTDGVVSLALNEHDIQDEALPDLICRSLQETHGVLASDLRVIRLHRENGAWYLPSGLRAELSPDFWGTGWKIAAEQSGWSMDRNAGRFWYCAVQGDYGLSLSSRWENPIAATFLKRNLIWGMTALAAAAVLILAIIGLDVRKTARGLERYASDQPWTRLRVSGGDELEGMASTLNSLVTERREEERRREREAASYRRFVPEQILKLLGKTSVLDVDKNTLVSRTMAVMQIAFSFPDPVYTNEANTRLLFDSVNQVIERTASIVRQKGGAVFDFAYDGYDVVMERDLEQVVSAAVAVRQEILSLNEQRAQDALPAVTLRIAIDIGEVIMGIVGDQDQIEPSTLSDSYVTLKELIAICGRIDANILCTEAITMGLEGYGSRYMGRCKAGRRSVRVYEVFDGDPYDVRRGKSANVHRFSEGVLSLYSGEIAQSKRVFLDLVRDAPRDGGARYYLYLSDRLTEEDALNGLSLNGRMETDDDKI